MSYQDELTQQVKELFDQAADQADLQNKVLTFVQARTKQSFINGLKAAKSRQSKPKGQHPDQNRD